MLKSTFKKPTSKNEVDTDCYILKASQCGHRQDQQPFWPVVQLWEV